jgi:WD40 repeat protein
MIASVVLLSVVKLFGCEPCNSNKQGTSPPPSASNHNHSLQLAACRQMEAHLPVAQEQIIQGHLLRAQRHLENPTLNCPKPSAAALTLLLETYGQLGQTTEIIKLFTKHKAIVQAIPAANRSHQDQEKRAKKIQEPRSGTAEQRQQAKEQIAAGRKRLSGKEELSKQALQTEKKNMLDLWEQVHPNPEALYLAARAAKKMGSLVEAFQLFDRAAIEWERISKSTFSMNEPRMNFEQALSAWSKQGDQIAFTNRHKIILVHLPDGQEQVIDMKIDVTALAWSPTGEQLAIGLKNGTIWLREAGKEKLVSSAKLKGAKDPSVLALVFSKDGKHLAGSSGKEVVVWNQDLQQEAQLTVPTENGASELQFSNDSKRLTGNTFPQIVQWKLPKDEKPVILSGPSDGTSGYMLAPDGDNFVQFAGMHDVNLVNLQRSANRFQFFKIGSCENHIHSGFFLEEGKTLAVAPNGLPLRYYNLTTGKRLSDIRPTEPVDSMKDFENLRVPNPKKNQIAYITNQHLFIKYLDHGKEISKNLGSASEESLIQFSAQGNYIMIKGEHFIRLWDTKDFLLLWERLDQRYAINLFALNDQGVIHYSQQESEHTTWTGKSTSNALTYQTIKERIFHCGFLKNSNRLMFAQKEKIQLRKDGKELGEGISGEYLWARRSFPKQNRVITSDSSVDNKEIEIYELPRKKLMSLSLPEPTGSTSTAGGLFNYPVLSENGRYLAYVARHHWVMIWDLQTKKLIKQINRHKISKDYVDAQAISNDGSLLLTVEHKGSGFGASIHLIETATEKELLQRKMSVWHMPIATTPMLDRMVVIHKDPDTQMMQFDIHTQKVTEFEVPEYSSPKQVFFHPSGNRMLFVSSKHSALFEWGSNRPLASFSFYQTKLGALLHTDQRVQTIGSPPPSALQCQLGTSSYVWDLCDGITSNPFLWETLWPVPNPSTP